MERLSSSFGRRLVVVLAVASILLVSGLGYLFYMGTRRRERNLVGVISVEGSIISSGAAGRVTAAINQAMFNDSVKAVVLRIDSPGGYAHLIEQIYLDVLELKREKPVVSSVAEALSGGYYIAVAADYIYTHPTSMVGNVGVIGMGPPTLIPSEIVMESGPYKVTGFSKLLFPFNLTHAFDSFVSAVEEGRGTRLRLSSTELRRGMVYMGSEAVAAGLVDEVGSFQRAVERAAEEANLVEYEVADVRPAEDTFSLSAAYRNETEVEWRDITVETLNRLNPPPAIYYLYLPPKAYVQGLASFESTAEGEEGYTPIGERRGTVVVDLSHGNKVSMWELDILAAELAMRNMALGFASTWDEVESALDYASCLIVAAPTASYSSEECERVEEFVGDGRLLLMFFDPTSEYLEIPALFGPINSLANRFGLSFGKGYLYNEREHYGLYRNIYVRLFANTSLTGNLETLVLFTATYLHHTDSDAAWTSGDTYSSTAERRSGYAPISVIEGGNGTVAALGDLTFLMEPYCYVEDNYQLIMNLVSAITAVEVPIEEEKEEIEYNVTRPELPVGTEKIFTEQINGEEQQLRWVRVSETEILIERPDRTSHYYYDENRSLVGWESNGMEATYDEPLPDLPYPLIKGKGWAYASGYNLTLDGEDLRGNITVKGWVDDFEDVEAGDGESYLCAKVREIQRDHLMRDETNITAVTTGYSWVSSEAGVVKEESETRYYVDDVLAKEETRRLLLTSIQKGEGEAS